jgi:hypothetical protein
MEARALGYRRRPLSEAEAIQPNASKWTGLLQVGLVPPGWNRTSDSGLGNMPKA